LLFSDTLSNAGLKNTEIEYECICKHRNENHKNLLGIGVLMNHGKK
jgi:hypothetical protein